MLTATGSAPLGTFVLGISEAITTFEAVCLLLQYGASVFLYRDSDTYTFHPKLYVVSGGDEHFAFVGSSNLTYPGWVNNVELNVRLSNGAVSAFQQYIDDLCGSSYAIPIVSIDDAKRAKEEGLLVSERQARDRREGSGTTRTPRRQLEKPRQPRHVAVDPGIQLQALQLFHRLQSAGFVLFQPTQEDVATFITDLGISEANRLRKCLANRGHTGTFEPNIDVKDALLEHQDFWGWPERYKPSKRGKHPEYNIRVRLKTHLTPHEGIVTAGRLWVRRRGANPQAEFRFRVGDAKTLRSYFDNSIGPNALFRVDRLVEDTYDVTVVRPSDVGYEDLAAMMVRAGHHKAAYL